MWIKSILPALMAILLVGCDDSSTGNEPGLAEPSSESAGAERLSGSKDSESGKHLSIIPLEEESPKAAATEEFALTDSETSEPKTIKQPDDEALHADEPKARIEALQSLVEENKRAAPKVLEMALLDGDDDVRRESLTLIYKKRVPVPSSVLHDVAVKDPNDQVRGMAWVNIVDRREPDLRQYLVDALNDPNPDIRRDAQLNLDKLDLEDLNIAP